MKKKAIRLLLDEDVLAALDRLGQSQGLSRHAIIQEACRYFLAQLRPTAPEPTMARSRPELELELMLRQKEAAEAQRHLLILQYERAIPDYPTRDPGALEWDIRRLERDIAALGAQIAAKRLEALERAQDS